MKISFIILNCSSSYEHDKSTLHQQLFILKCYTLLLEVVVTWHFGAGYFVHCGGHCYD